MRKLIAVALIVSPLALNAAMKGSADDTVTKVVVSTGVHAPTRIHDARINYIATDFPEVTATDNTVRVHFVVDQAGVPTDVQVTKGLSKALDARVIAAVSQYRYEPGKLNGQKVAVPVELNVVFQK